MAEMETDAGSLNQSAPLTGLRVLQFGSDLASQMVGLALADLGADVIRCGPVKADPFSAALERGKRVFETPLEVDALIPLVSGADVVIGSDLAPPRAAAAFPATALLLSLPAFPSDDPRFAGKGTDEGTVLAAAGVLAERGPSNRLRGLGPANMPMPIASAYAAAYGTLGVVAGILGRQQTGRGDAIEVSLFGALMEGFSYNHVKIASLPDRYVDPRSLVETPALPLPESQVQALIDPMYRAFQCADNVWFYIATPPHRGLIKRLLRLLGLWDTLLADGLPTDDPYLSTRDWNDSVEGSILGYPRLARHWRDRIRTEITNVIRTRPSAHWEQQFTVNGLCGSRVQSSAVWLASPEAGAAGLAISLIDPLSGPMTCAGPFMWAGQPPSPKPRAIVECSELSWHGEAWSMPEPGPRKPFLSGVRVLDLCNVIAGPTVAGCLTRFGADVIKIDPTIQDFDPSITILLSLQSARGKRSMLVDLASDAGGNLFAQMAATADLITFNGTQSQMDALGMNFGLLSALNSSIVLAQISAFGGPVASPNDDRKGVDEVLQAATGVMHRLKPPHAPPEEYAHYGTIDVATGVWGAAAAVAGMINAGITGKGMKVETSLAAGAAAVQMPFLWESAACGPAPDPVGAIDDKFPATGRVEAGGYIAPDGKREALATYAELRTRLALYSGDAHATVGFVRYADHPAGSPVELVTPCAILCKRTPLVAVGNPAKYGADTREVLARLGFAESEIARLLACGAVAESWPHHDQFLPD